MKQRTRFFERRARAIRARNTREFAKREREEFRVSARCGKRVARAHECSRGVSLVRAAVRRRSRGFAGMSEASCVVPHASPFAPTRSSDSVFELHACESRSPDHGHGSTSTQRFVEAASPRAGHVGSPLWRALEGTRWRACRGRTRGARARVPMSRRRPREGTRWRSPARCRRFRARRRVSRSGWPDRSSWPL